MLSYCCGVFQCALSPGNVLGVLDLKREEVETSVGAALGSSQFDLVDWNDDANGNVVVARVKEAGSGGWTVVRLVAVRNFRLADVYTNLLTPLGPPACIYPRALLIKDDLVATEYVDGYRLVEGPWTEEELEMALAAVARLHAASLVTHHAPQKYREETIFKTDVDSPEFQMLCATLVALEGLLDVYYSHMTQEVVGRAMRLMTSASERLAIVESRSKVSVVSHGCVWNNTVAFNQSSGSAILVRWDKAKVCGPAWDVLFAIYASGAGQAPLQARLIHYYNALSRCLASSDVSVHGVMTWAQFEEAAKDLEPVMVALVPVFLITAILPESEGDLSAACLNAMRTSDMYRKRLSHSLHNLFEFIAAHPIH